MPDPSSNLAPSRPSTGALLGAAVAFGLLLGAGVLVPVVVEVLWHPAPGSAEGVVMSILLAVTLVPTALIGFVGGALVAARQGRPPTRSRLVGRSALAGALTAVVLWLAVTLRPRDAGVSAQSILYLGGPAIAFLLAWRLARGKRHDEPRVAR